jgi:hypothetical protein
VVGASAESAWFGAGPLPTALYTFQTSTSAWFVPTPPPSKLVPAYDSRRQGLSLLRSRPCSRARLISPDPYASPLSQPQPGVWLSAVVPPTCASPVPAHPANQPRQFAVGIRSRSRSCRRGELGDTRARRIPDRKTVGLWRAVRIDHREAVIRIAAVNELQRRERDVAEEGEHFLVLVRSDSRKGTKKQGFFLSFLPFFKGLAPLLASL